MKDVKVANKGYTIEVVSWENDGDNYKTETMTVETESEARKIKKICSELFKSCNNGDGGIGNSMCGECEDVIEDYIENNPEMELTTNYIKELASELLGYSEDYDYRVCERVLVTYLDQDVYAQVID
jgi:hypothetical protein